MIALEYISHGLKQKYSGYCGTVLFLMGCTAYFFVVTGLNHYTSFEGALGIGYGRRENGYYKELHLKLGK